MFSRLRAGEDYNVIVSARGPREIPADFLAAAYVIP